MNARELPWGHNVVIEKLKTLLGHEGFRKYAANTSWLFVERLVRMGVALLVGVYVVRYLGPEQFGQLSFAQSFVGLFAPIAALGLDNVVVRDLVKSPDKRDRLLGTAFGLKLGGAAFSVCAIIFACQFTNNTIQDNEFVLILAFGLFFQATSVIDLYFQSMAQSRFIVQVQLVQTLLASIVKLLLVWFGASLSWFVASYLFDAICLALGFVFLAKKQVLLLVFRSFNLADAKHLLTESLPLIFAGLAVAVYMRIDQVMLKEMLGDVAVGQFSAALKLSEAWYFIPMAICNSVFPAIVAAKTQSESAYYKRMQQLYDLMVLLAVIVAVPVTFMAGPIIHLLYGNAYEESVAVLQIHIWTGPFVFLGVAMSGWLIAEGFSKKSLYRTVLGAIVNVGANLWLIPIYGPVGAAVATLLGQVSANILYDFLDRDVRDQLRIKMRAFLPIHLLRNKVLR